MPKNVFDASIHETYAEVSPIQVPASFRILATLQYIIDAKNEGKKEGKISLAEYVRTVITGTEEFKTAEQKKFKNDGYVWHTHETSGAKDKASADALFAKYGVKQTKREKKAK